MKKLLFFLISLSIIGSTLAQDLKKWEIGLEAGFNMSRMTGQWGEASRDISVSENSKSKWIGSPAFGILAAYNFTPLIALTAGLYMMKSGVRYVTTYEGDGGSQEWSQRQRFTTIRLPIMARFMWGTTWQYYFLAGFYVSKRLCGKYVYTDWQGEEQSWKVKFTKDDESSESGDVIYLNTDQFKRINIGLQAGAGIRRALGPGVIYFAATFGYGLIDFNKFDSKDDRPDGYKPFHDKNIAFLFGYAILLGASM